MVMTKRTAFTLGLTVFSVGIFLVTLVYFIAVPPETIGKVVLLDQPKPISPITFQKPDEETTTLKEFQGKWVVLFFGYKSCPDICPMSLGYAASEWRRLGERQRQVELVFISVDPERDSPEDLKRYAESFNPNFHGLTAPDSTLVELSQQLGVFYRKEPTDSALGYLMSHSSDFFILNPAGQWVGSFRGEKEPGGLAQHLKQLFKNGGV